MRYLISALDDLGEMFPTRAVQVLPLGLELTVAVEDLHPVVLTVGYVDPTIGVTADVVDDIELAFTGAGLTSRHQQLSVRRVFVDAGVAVPSERFGRLAHQVVRQILKAHRLGRREHRRDADLLQAAAAAP